MAASPFLGRAPFVVCTHDDVQKVHQQGKKILHSLECLASFNPRELGRTYIGILLGNVIHSYFI
jgi:hypothetical protein